jgi:hypothetical protein
MKPAAPRVANCLGLHMRLRPEKKKTMNYEGIELRSKKIEI